MGDIVNERGLEYIYYDQEKFKDVHLMMQVHDSIAFQIPINIGWWEHAKILLDIKKSLETPLKTHGFEFVVPADISMGYNLYKNEMQEIKHLECPDNIVDLADLLKEKEGLLDGPTTK